MLVTLYYDGDYPSRLLEGSMFQNELNGVMNGPSYWTSEPSGAARTKVPMQLVEIKIEENLWADTLTANALTKKQDSIHQWMEGRELRIRPDLYFKGNILIGHSNEYFLSYNDEEGSLIVSPWNHKTDFEGFDWLVSFHSRDDIGTGLDHFEKSIKNGENSMDWAIRYLRERDNQYLGSV